MASAGQLTVDAPFAGTVNVGRVIVYVYVQSALFPAQSVYVNVYTWVPLHAGAAPVAIVGVSVLPQASFTTGGVGVTASAGQLTVDAPFAGTVNVGRVIVYVYVQSALLPAQSV